MQNNFWARLLTLEYYSKYENQNNFDKIATFVFLFFLLQSYFQMFHMWLMMK